MMLCAYGWTLSAAYGWTLCVAYGYIVPLDYVHVGACYVRHGYVPCTYVLRNSPHGTVNTARVRRFGELSVQSLGRVLHYAHVQTSRGPLPRRGKWGHL